ncbi:ankyrin [Anaeromyces robustus]|uniref:Ankyrin n=1 Tax=Anaeromyces robustus TaxID=1754192 RepID=A0A1Y1XMS4_9FUNG|nr:ankyrin [Anaeromyces robustus]|eukprot:ORX87038.1 ankyrin [Anaeromyces robustus]
MDSLIQYSDLFFFKIQQKLFFLLTVSDDNPEKNVFVSKEFYDEIIKKNYLEVKDKYITNYDNASDASKSNGSIQNYNVNNRNIYEINRLDNNGGKYEERKNINHDHDNNIFHDDNISRYDNSSNYPNGMNSFTGKKLNDYNNNNSNNNNTISEFNNNSRNISSSSSYQSSYTLKNELSRNSLYDDFYSNARKDNNDGFNNMENNIHKNSISFINGTSSSMRDEKPFIKRDDNYTLRNVDNFNDLRFKKEPLDYCSEPFNLDKNKLSSLLDNSYNRDNDDRYNKYTLPEPSSRSFKSGNNQDLHLPRIHESITGFNDNQYSKGMRYSDFNGSNDEFHRISCQYLDDSERLTNNRSNINDLLNDNAINQVVPNNNSRLDDCPRYSKETRNNDNIYQSRNRIDYDPINDQSYYPEERIRKRQNEFMNDDDSLRKRPMSDISLREDMRRNSFSDIGRSHNDIKNRPLEGINNTMRPMRINRNSIDPIDSINNLELNLEFNNNHYPNNMMNRTYSNNKDNRLSYHRNLEEGQSRENGHNDPRYYSGLYNIRVDSFDINKRSQDNMDDYNSKNQYKYPKKEYEYHSNSTMSRYYNSPIFNKPSIKPDIPEQKSLSTVTTYHKKLENINNSIVHPQQPSVNAIDMLEEESNGRNSFYPTIKYKFKNYKVSEIEKERLFDISFDYILNKNSNISDDLKSFQSVMRFMTPIIIDRFYDINDLVINKYLLNQYINFDILEYFFTNLNKYFSNSINSGNPIFQLVLVENEQYLNFLPNHLIRRSIQSVIKFSKCNIKLSKNDIYRYYLYHSQIQLIVKQCGMIRDLMINILNAAYIKHDVDQIKKIHNYPDIVNTFKLVKACINNDTSKINAIINETSTAIHYRTIQGYTPLHLAINNDNLEVTKVLLRCEKIDVNIYDKYGFSPIFYAILKRRYDVLKMLLSHPSVKINFKNVTGLCPLLFSIVLNNTEALKIILQHPETDINVTDKHSNTALINLLSNTRNLIEDYQRMIYHFFALERTRGYNDMGNLKMSKDGKDEDDYIIKKYILDKIEGIADVPLQQNELMNLIINHPRIDLSKKNDYYNNALFYAAKNFNIEMVNKILKKSNNFNINERLFNGKTVFHKTIKKKSDKVIKGVQMNNNHNGSLLPVLPSPSSSSNTPNSSINSMNTPQSSSNVNYSNGVGNNSGSNNDNKYIMDDYNNINYSYSNHNNGPNHSMPSSFYHNHYEQERNKNYYSPPIMNEYIGGESITIQTLYNMMTSDLHQDYINHHERADNCHFCKAYLSFLNNINDEYERLIQLSTEDIIRYEIIKLFLNNPSVNVNIQDDKGITPIMKAVICHRFDLLVLIFRMRLLKIDLSIKNYKNETSIQVSSCLGYNDCTQLQLVHKIYLQHIYQ